MAVIILGLGAPQSRHLSTLHPHAQGPVQVEACQPGGRGIIPKDAALLRKRERSSQRLHTELREM